MLQVRVLSQDFFEDLESDVNKALKSTYNVVDIKYSTASSSRSGSGVIYSAMIMYREK